MKKRNKAIAILVLILSTSLVIPATQVPYYGTVDVQAAQKLNVTHATLIKGNTLTLKLGSMKANKITWTSSKSSVATVKKGIVTAKKKGTATITAKYKGKKYTCKVTVETPSISQKSTEMNIDETAKLTVNGTSQKVKWSSSDTSVVIVNSSGKLTGIGEGTATVTGKIGNNKYRCDVTVYDPSDDTEETDDTETEDDTEQTDDTETEDDTEQADNLVQSTNQTATYATVSGDVTYFYNI